MNHQQALSVVEPVLLQSHGGLFVSKRRMAWARIELTSTRLVVYKKSIWLTGFGLIGALIARSMKGSRTLDLDLGAITQIARGKYGFNKKILDVTMKDGATHRITVDRFDEMVARLREAAGPAVKIAA
jgi:hypothetical protein